MTPIPERFLVSAVPIGGGERVTGYYCKRLMLGLKGPRQVEMIQVALAEDHLRWIEIDPDTIEPVKVKPIRLEWEFAWKEGQYRHFCPNCELDCKTVNDENRLEYCLAVFGQPDYCPWCGQALDWG